jgi:hypothetical protein
MRGYDPSAQETLYANENQYSFNQGLQNAQANYSMFNQNLQSSDQPQPSNTAVYPV